MQQLSLPVEQFIPHVWQSEGSDFICSPETGGRMILADEMRLGKTGTVYLARKRLAPRTTLLLCGKNAQYVWRDQAPHWGIEPPVIVEGQSWDRAKLWASQSETFFTCTREAFKVDLKAGVAPCKWDMVITDEAAKDTNRKTGNWKALSQLESTYLLLVSGSAVRRGPESLWALLNLINRRKWSSYWRYVEKYCNTMRNQWGGFEILGAKNTAELREEIKHVFLRRTFKEVMPFLPPKQRDLSHKLQLTDMQRHIYDQLCEDLIAELPSGGLVVAPNVMTKIIRLRQLLLCPQILDRALGIGACMEHFFELLEDSDDQHCVVFTPFTDAMEPFHNACIARKLPAPIQIKGGMHPDDLGRAVARFKETRGIAIVSIQYAEAFDLSTATWGYFLGYEWDPWANLQAEDRLRGTQIKQPTFYYYPQHTGRIDESLIMDALDTKTNNINRVLHSIAALRAALRR